MTARLVHGNELPNSRQFIRRKENPMKTARWLPLAMAAVALAAVSGLPAQAAVTAVEEMLGGKKVMVLENESLRLAVLPNPGGTIVQFINKKSGTDFVAGGARVLAGRLGYGWADWNYLRAVEKASAPFYGLPYTAEFRSGPGYKAIHVFCEQEGIRVEREMRLADEGRALTVLLRNTNTSDKPQMLMYRFHPYTSIGDPKGGGLVVALPGKPGEIRKVSSTGGWSQDRNFYTTDGYWLAANYTTGEGLWMTFRKEQTPTLLAWVDRSAFTLEPMPMPVMAQPGESVQYEGAYCPFTAGDRAQDLPLAQIADAAEQERARQFLSQVKPNLGVIGPYTMVRKDDPLKENRFGYGHARRDRMGIRPWGFVDGLVAIDSLQSTPLRCRYYARMFDSWTEVVTLTFRVCVEDAMGKMVKETRKEFTVDPAKSRELDVRDDPVIADLADGDYTFSVDVLVRGEQGVAHHFADRRRLVGGAWAEALRASEQEKPLVEPPFVAALRTVEWAAPSRENVRIPLGVEEGGGVARSGWPVRAGVPFPQGVLGKTFSLSVAAPDGRSVPAQFAPMSTWPDGSVKWLLVDFQADVPANGHVFYSLRSLATASPAARPLVTQDGQRFTLDTGVQKLEWTDGPASKVLGVFGPDDLWWDDAKGTRYLFCLKGEDAGTVVEENGPLRAVVKTTGWYYDAQERPVCMGELRLECYRNKRFVRLFHTVMFAGDVWNTQLGSYGIRLDLGANRFDRAAVEMDGRALDGTRLSMCQGNSDLCRVATDGAAPNLGHRSTGGVLLSGRNERVSIRHLNFWQMAPKALSVDATKGVVTISYWPKEAGALSLLPDEERWVSSSPPAWSAGIGMSRTQEMVIDFDSAQSVTDVARVHGEPVLSIVPPRYLASTRAMLHLSPYDPEHAAGLEKVMSESFDLIPDQQRMFAWYGQWVYGAIPRGWYEAEHRWPDNGRYAWILNEQDIVQTPWLLYMRSGDRKYYTFAEANTRQLMEVGTIRWTRMFPADFGMSRRHHACLWLGGGDSGHSMLDPFMEYYHVTGYRPAWDACKRMAVGMSRVSAGGWRYISNPVAGLARMYIETQDSFYKEHADRIWNTLCYPDKNEWWLGDHGDRMVLWYSQINPQCGDTWKAWTFNPEIKKKTPWGGVFSGADVLAALYEQTGDLKYGHAARQTLPRGPLARFPHMPDHQGLLSQLRALCYVGVCVGVDASPGALKEPQPIIARRTIVKEEADQDFEVAINGTVGEGGLKVTVVGPDGKEAVASVVAAGEHRPWTIRVPKDGRAGEYVITIPFREPKDRLMTPLTRLPEVYLPNNAAGKPGWWWQHAPTIYFTRSRGNQPETLEIAPHGANAGSILNRDGINALPPAPDGKTFKVQVGPEGVWIIMKSGYVGVKNQPILAVSPERWFLPSSLGEK